MNLTPDTLYSLALKLNGGELLKMCSTDRKTRSICTSEKFNPIWTEKLLADYNVQYSGNNAYMEYLQHTYLYKQTYWVATIFNKNDNYIVVSKIFKNHEDAAAFLANEQTKYISRNPQFGKPKFYEIFASVKEMGFFEDRWNKYEITESEFETKSQASKGYNNYISRLKNLYNLVSSVSSEPHKSYDFKHFMEDFNYIIAERSESFSIFKGSLLSSYVENELSEKQLEKIKEAYEGVLEEEKGENNEEEEEDGDEEDEEDDEEE